MKLQDGNRKQAPAMKRTNMYFTSSQAEKLAELSIKTGTPIAELVRRAVDDFLASKKVSTGEE